MNVLVVSHVKFRIQLSLSVTFFLGKALLLDHTSTSAVLPHICIMQLVSGVSRYVLELSYSMCARLQSRRIQRCTRLRKQ